MFEIALFLFFLTALYLLRKIPQGYFELPDALLEPIPGTGMPRPQIYLRDCLMAFLLYFLFQVAIPAFIYSCLAAQNDSQPLSWQTEHWLVNSALLVSLLVLIAFTLSFKREKRLLIWGEGNALSSICFGYYSMLMAYPAVTLLSQSLNLLLSILSQETLQDQVAISKLKETLIDYPILTFTCFNIGITVPLVEEILFRGFLQRYLKQALGLKRALLLSSLIFAALHFSAKQGLENIILLPSLFLFSLFLGWNRERSGSLFGSVALHAAFNQLNTIALLILQ